MPLHLLGKKSWNVYNAENIARVKADEAAAAAREAANEQRMQELDAARRAAILRGQTPPPLPDEIADDEGRQKRDKDVRGHDRKRRKLAGEDDTDMDIRLARSMTAPDRAIDDGTKILKLRNTSIDAPLTNHAGNIDLFPVDIKEEIKRDRNSEVEKEKKKKEKALEDQYSMRFSNAAGKDGLSKPWYATGHQPSREHEDRKDLVAYGNFENKDVWGNEDPRRKEREISRITSNDPFAFMQKAQAQLKRAKEDKKKWIQERNRELRELQAAGERDDRRSRHHKRKKRDEDNTEGPDVDGLERGANRERSSYRKHHHRSRSRSRSEDKKEYRSSHRRERRRSRSRDKYHDRHRDRDRDRNHRNTSNHREKPSSIEQDSKEKDGYRTSRRE